MWWQNSDALHSMVAMASKIRNRTHMLCRWHGNLLSVSDCKASLCKLLATVSLQVSSMCLIWVFEQPAAIAPSEAPGPAAAFWHHNPATLQIIRHLI
jgi:hypothetical protein